MRFGLLLLLSLGLTLPASVSAGEKEDDVVLELQASAKSFWVDMPVRLKLVLRGRGVRRVLEGTPGLQPSRQGSLFGPDSNDRFVMLFEVRPEKAGELVLGPYSLQFGGRALRSNRLVLQVQETPEVPSSLQLRVEPAELEIGQTFKLFLTASDERAHQATLKTTRRYKIKSQSTSVSYNFSNGKRSERHVRIYELEPTRPGKQSLGRGDLEKLPPGVRVETVTLRVHKKSKARTPEGQPSPPR